jgi:hypothetical protein
METVLEVRPEVDAMKANPKAGSAGARERGWAEGAPRLFLGSEEEGPCQISANSKPRIACTRW